MVFFVNGIETIIVVDEFIPVKSNKMPAFTASKNQELWAILLEKGLTKVIGSYANIESINPHVSFDYLFGTNI